MKLDTILDVQGQSFRITAGAPVMRAGRCFVPLMIRRHRPRSRDERTED